MFKMAGEELADCANYIRYLYIKLRMVELYVNEELSKEELPGMAGFHKLGGKFE